MYAAKSGLPGALSHKSYGTRAPFPTGLRFTFESNVCVHSERILAERHVQYNLKLPSHSIQMQKRAHEDRHQMYCIARSRSRALAKYEPGFSLHETTFGRSVMSDLMRVMTDEQCADRCADTCSRLRAAPLSESLECCAMI